MSCILLSEVPLWPNNTTFRGVFLSKFFLCSHSYDEKKELSEVHHYLPGLTLILWRQVSFVTRYDEKGPIHIWKRIRACPNLVSNGELALLTVHTNSRTGRSCANTGTQVKWKCSGVRTTQDKLLMTRTAFKLRMDKNLCFVRIYFRIPCQ